MFSVTDLPANCIACPFPFGSPSDCSTNRPLEGLEDNVQLAFQFADSLFQALNATILVGSVMLLGRPFSRIAGDLGPAIEMDRFADRLRGVLLTVASSLLVYRDRCPLDAERPACRRPGADSWSKGRRLA